MIRIPEASHDARPAPVRAAVILPWEKPHGGEKAAEQGIVDASRAAEARLAEAMGLAASIGLVVVHSAILPLRQRRPSTLLGEGQMAAEKEHLTEGAVTVAIVDASLSPVQQRNLERGWELQGDRPDRPHPRHLRRACGDPEGDRCRLSLRIWTTSAPAWSVRGPIWSGSVAASDFSAVRARRRSRRTGG